MTSANHMLAGAAIALTVSNPVLAVTAALGSHYAMDALPHFGYKQGGYGNALKHRLTYWVVGISSIQLLLFSVFLLSQSQFFALGCAIVAVSPDIVGALQYFIYEKKNKSVPVILQIHRDRLHARIQKFERPWGLAVDVVFSVVVTFIVIDLL